MLNPLTSLRFGAALMVFVWHAHLWNHITSKYELGYAGVSFFYVLSGFILTYVYLEKLRSGSLKHIKSFYIARIAKLFPVHVLAFFICLPLVIPAIYAINTPAGIHSFLRDAFVNLLLVQSYFPISATNFSFNAVAWSISVEMFFYALTPLLFIGVGLMRHRLTIKRMLLSMAVVWLVLFALLVDRTAVVNQWAYYVFPLIRLPDFILGIFVCLVFWELPKHINIEAASPRLVNVIEAGSLLLAAIGILISPLLPQSLHFDVVFLPFWTMVILVFAHQKGAISRILSMRPLVYLGEISFSFYMLHQLIIRYARTWGVPHGMFVSLIVAVAASAAVYSVYEEPMRLRTKDSLEKLIKNPFARVRPITVANLDELGEQAS